MNISLGTLQKIKILMYSILGWMLAVFIGLWVIADTPMDLDHFVESIVGGILGGICSHYLSLNLRKLTRKLCAWRLVLFRTFSYVLMITLITLLVAILRSFFVDDKLGFAILYSNEFHEFILGWKFTSLMLILILSSFLINFIVQVHRMFGPGIFAKLFLGTYYNPIKEKRIFMFIDIDDSTAIAEKLGPEHFAAFKNDFFYDLAEPVLMTRGEIFQYIGDEAVITWNYSKGVQKANWIRCFFLLEKEIKKNKNRYLNRYGIVPGFKAGCHGGRVISTEVGDIKRDIVYSGDAVNTAARIAGKCKTLGKNFLVSESLLSQTKSTKKFEKTNMGYFELRGKTESLQLFALAKNGSV